MTIHRIRLGMICLAIFTLLVSLTTAAGHAQSTTQGSISGSVLDSTGAAVPGAAIVINKPATGFAVKLAADASGFYKAPLLEPGIYTVSVSAPGFAAYRADNVVVFVGQVTTVVPRLAVASSATEVVVTAQTPVMNLESPDFTSSLNSAAMQNIPVNNRRWSALALMTPGVQ